ncbi:EAL domain-containing protein [uncultured Propionivibrio sp.]|uniref:putative bifunctional diguanylate cyclase/phosphodiesterase n=1 Tax=uncultured Propionivibrio sp. TaxID=426737 RepID=UPI0029C09ADF|nr:EAL domain-containing protein [uncultured Propionivibrio sp.]
MATPSDPDDWELRKGQIVGLGERSFRKSYYPQLRQNLDRLQRFRLLLDRTTDIVVMLSVPEGKVVDGNEAFGVLLGEPIEALIGRDFASLGLGDTERILEILSEDACWAARDRPVDSHSMLTEFSRDGRTVCFDLSLRTTLIDNDCYCVVVARDVTEREQAHALVEGLLAEKEALLENALVGIVHTCERRIVACNRRIEEIFGYPPGGMIGQSTRIFYPTDYDFSSVGEEAYRSLGESGKQFSVTLQMQRVDGTPIWCELSGRALDAENPVSGAIWVISDVTERHLAEERARFLAYHDVLTGLPNPQLFQDRLQQAVAFATRAGTKVALLLIDIDRFKAVNDVLGHEVGDRLLVEVARRIEENTRATDTLCRQGGDEYLLLLTNVAEPDAIATCAAELMANLAEPFSVDRHELTISVSIGVAIYPEDGTDYSTLLKKADMAMYRSKESGRNTYRFFNEEMNDEAVAQVTLFSGLRRALDARQFVLHYQPQLEIGSGRLLGAEALIRWNHPDLGLVYPGRFIPVAEETGLIADIGDWVLREACAEAVEWRRVLGQDMVVAVNLSALQFKRGDVEKTVAEALEATGLDPSMLELELTESILIRDTESILAAVKRLKLMGIRLSIDDFGTGYSSLSYLKRFEVDKLKIDQSFVRDLAHNPEDAAIVRAIIQMAHSLGLKTIAEGVENREVLDLLKIYRCDEAQGYHFARPLPADRFLAFAAERGI